MGTTIATTTTKINENVSTWPRPRFLNFYRPPDMLAVARGRGRRWGVQTSQAMPPPPPSSVILFLMLRLPMNHLKHYKSTEQSQVASFCSLIVTKKVSHKYHSQMKVTLKVIVALSWLKILHYFGKFKSQEFSQFLPGQRTSQDEEEDKKNASKLSHKLERAQHFFILCEIVTTFWNSSKSK